MSYTILQSAPYAQSPKVRAILKGCVATMMKAEEHIVAKHPSPCHSERSEESLSLPGRQRLRSLTPFGVALFLHSLLNTLEL